MIATFVKQGFIRSIFGDYLVVILLYCLIKSFIKINSTYAALAVLIIAFGIEFLQLTNFLEVINLKENKLAKLILGNTFQFEDLIAYTLGIFTILFINYKMKLNRQNKY
jgi:hypothetical protein